MDRLISQDLLKTRHSDLARSRHSNLAITCKQRNLGSLGRCCVCFGFEFFYFLMGKAVELSTGYSHF